MSAIVVYESMWGNTAAIAHAVAEGIGAGTQVFSTAQATNAVLADVDLLVAGAPVIGFGMSSERKREDIRRDSGKAPTPPDLTHPAMSSWLETLPPGRGHAAAFETRIWWSPRGATQGIIRGLERAGYRVLGKGERFIVDGTYGPLREGELERARQWGEALARAVQT